jgi:hypothetical protein
VLTGDGGRSVPAPELRRRPDRPLVGPTFEVPVFEVPAFEVLALEVEAQLCRLPDVVPTSDPHGCWRKLLKPLLAPKLSRLDEEPRDWGRELPSPNDETLESDR